VALPASDDNSRYRLRRLASQSTIEVSGTKARLLMALEFYCWQDVSDSSQCASFRRAKTCRCCRQLFLRGDSLHTIEAY